MTLLRHFTVLFTFLFFFTGLCFAAPAVVKGKDDKAKDLGTKPNYDVSGFARLSSNYIDRGLSMSNGSFAFNAAFLINLGSQFKFGFWGSNISNLGAQDDNLWVKYIAEVFVDFQQNAKFIFFVHDDHYYKSDFRNGQRFGFKLDYARFTGMVESQNNFEGTGSSAFYTQLKFNKKYTEKTGIEVGAGYTMQYSQHYNDYFDFLGTVFYKPFSTGRFEAGMTLPSNPTQFGSRSHLGYFIGFQLDY